MSRRKNTTTGPLPKVPHEVLLALVTKHKLTKSMLAQLSRSSIKAISTGGYSSSTVAEWMSGKVLMRQAVYELVTAKLWFVEHGRATMGEVLSLPLPDLLTMKWPGKRVRLHSLS